MSMIVKNNLAAQVTLGELNKNINKAGVLLAKISSGEKINSAKDDASGYAISEKMREQIRSLIQDNQNVQNGSSLLRTAEGGIDNIVEELRNLKELAINAANDTNTDDDRKTIQKEFDSKIANINDIATETNYNGKKLLDGTWWERQRISGANPGPDSSKIVHSGAIEPTGTVTTISSGDFTISSDGVYELAAGYSGTLTINAQNVKITQADPSTALNNVFMVGPSGGNANLWIENLNISNSQEENFIKFQGSDNILNFKGTNNVDMNPIFSYVAAIHVGGGLTVEGGTDGTGILNFTATGARGSFIGGDVVEDLSNVNIVVNSGNYNTSGFNLGAFIGASLFGSIGDITVNDGIFTDTYNNGANGAVIGGGQNVGNIYISNASFDVWCDNRNEVAIGCGSGSLSAEVGEISIKIHP